MKRWRVILARLRSDPISVLTAESDRKTVPELIVLCEEITGRDHSPQIAAAIEDEIETYHVTDPGEIAYLIYARTLEANPRVRV